ncbi:MAG: hypothetical protein ACRBFS_06705 [Aureispira sp.]
MKFTSFILLFFSCYFLKAQSSLDIQIGWTFSNVRVLYDKSTVRLGPVADEFLLFDPLHRSFLGLTYTYQIQRVHLSTGLSLLILGASDIPAAPDHPWINTYFTTPFMIGYSFSLSKKIPLKLTIRTGIDLGYRLGNGVLGDEKWWGLLNLTTGLELTWRCFKLGTRGHWGMNNFFEYRPFHYHHTGLTTYLGYTFWDSKKAKAKRLERQQARQLMK